MSIVSDGCDTLVRLNSSRGTVNDADAGCPSVKLTSRGLPAHTAYNVSPCAAAPMRSPRFGWLVSLPYPTWNGRSVSAVGRFHVAPASSEKVIIVSVMSPVALPCWSYQLT